MYSAVSDWRNAALSVNMCTVDLFKCHNKPGNISQKFIVEFWKHYYLYCFSVGLGSQGMGV
jgi:hypothetical protein